MSDLAGITVVIVLIIALIGLGGVILLILKHIAK